MKKFIFAAFLCAACGDTIETYTWGDVALELSTGYCNAFEHCGLKFDDGEEALCVEHTSWHLCNVDRSCDWVVDAQEAMIAVDYCNEAFAQLDADGCFFLTSWGVVPEECAIVLDLKPEMAP